MAAETYRFRRAVPNDLPMIRRWLRVPEVARWWGAPDEQIELITEDIELPEMATLIVSYRNRPFAFAQHYDAHQWPQPHFAHLPKGTRCIDAFIGVPDMMGCGHGKMFLQLLAQMLIDRGAPMVAIDPDPENIRARKSYEAAGFIGDTEYETGDGPCVLMQFKQNAD